MSSPVEAVTPENDTTETLQLIYETSGNYDIVAAGVGMMEENSADININIPGTSVKKAFLYWSVIDGFVRNDNYINFNNGVVDTVLVDNSPKSEYWYNGVYRYAYVAEVTDLVSNGMGTYTISNLTLVNNNGNAAKDGAGLIVVYEDPGLPVKYVEIREGLDRGHLPWRDNFPTERGVTAVNCVEFPGEGAPFDLELDFVYFIGGGEDDKRPNALCYQRGTGSSPESLIDWNGLLGEKYPDATYLAGPSEPYPANSNEGPEWDTYSDTVNVFEGDTYACLHFASVADPENINTVSSNFDYYPASMAILMFAYSYISELEEPPTCCEPVMQCDEDVTFVLNSLPEARILRGPNEAIYIALHPANPADERIKCGDIRISQPCPDGNCPNTMVGPNDMDNGQSAELVQDAVFSYLDINNNGKFDIYDPVYVDLDNDGLSRGDIRITDVPPIDVLNSTGGLLYEAGSWGESRWTEVEGSIFEDDWMAANDGFSFLPIDSGDPDLLLGYVDADCNGNWGSGDKLYLNQPHTDQGDHFDSFVTIGDVRVYIPPNEPCGLVCGTKVIENDHDVVYAFSPTEAALAWYFLGPEEPEIYIDMDLNQRVSAGDVRLTSVSNHYDPNTKVKSCDVFDIGHDLNIFPDQTLVRYLDLDAVKVNGMENTGYTARDPVYIDLDNNGLVSGGDIRLTDVPVCNIVNETGYVVLYAGQYGNAWSIVRELPPDEDVSLGLPLQPLPDGAGGAAILNDLLAYVDADCDGEWSCVDKLYIQQLTGLRQFDNFASAGDLRLYVPPEAIEEENWPACGTKVMPCTPSPDLTYALYDSSELGIEMHYAYADRDGVFGFSEDDLKYIDMDEDKHVSEGDIRLSRVVVDFGDETFIYEACTKVKGPHDKDLNGNWNLIWFNEDADMYLRVFDADCTGSWTCKDSLYQLNENCLTSNLWNLQFVTHLDCRVYVPDCSCLEPFDPVAAYDTNGIPGIQKEEVYPALDDYFMGLIDKDTVIAVIGAYLTGT